jgi:hypothetical protein
MAKTLREELQETEARAEHLRRLIQSEHCTTAGHDWKSIGGANCGCPDGYCSVPVYECKRCGDCDYGENREAEACRQNCDREKGDL